MINIVYAFFDTFGIVDAATEGGPGKDTAILVYKVYYDGFKALDLGGSAAQSVVLMVIVDRAHRRAVPLRREEGATTERRWSSAAPSSTFLTHAVLAARRAAIVAFPVYLTFVASTHTAQEIVQAPMPLLPGDQCSRTTRPRSPAPRTARARARRSAA